MNENEYDDSPWTKEEVEALAWEAAERSGWDEWIDEIPDRNFAIEG